MVHLQITSVESSHLGLAFENDVVNLTAFGLACISEQVIKLPSEEDHGTIRLGFLLKLV